MSTRRRARRTTVLALALTAGLALASCGGDEPVTFDPDAEVTLTWWTGQTADAQARLDELAREFEQEHPNVTIEASGGAPTTDELLQKMSAGFAGGNYPDISYAFGSWATELANSGRTLDITEQVEDPEVAWEEFPEPARLTAAPDGKVIGFPALVDNLSLLYNKTLFDQAGVAYPTPDWTWDDFREAARQITDPARNVYGAGFSVSGTEDTTWHFWPLLWQRGGEILTADQERAAFNSQAGVDALEFLRQMAVEDKSFYLDQTDERYVPLFASDRVGMVISGPWVLFDLVEAGTSYGVSPLPGHNGSHETISGPDLWVLLDHQDPNRAHWAYEFVKWLTSAEQDVRWNVAQGNLPLRPLDENSAAYQEFVEQYPGVEVMIANFDNAKKARPTVPGYVALSEAVGEAVSGVMQGAMEPKEALDEAAAEADQALAQS